MTFSAEIIRENSMRLRLLCVCSAATAFLSGCGGDHQNNTLTRQGIVLSFSKDKLITPGVVTLADLQTVGAGVPVHLAELDEIGYATPLAYQNGSFPTTDAEGRFSISVDRNSVPNALDRGSAVIEYFFYVSDRCSTTSATEAPGAAEHFFSEQSGDPYDDHRVNSLMSQAGAIAQAQYPNEPVIIVSTDNDACTVPSVELEQK